MFYKALAIVSIIAVGTASADAQKSFARSTQPSNPRGGPLDAGPTLNIYSPPSAHPEQHRLDGHVLQQVALWGRVGRCVVASDRESSVSYVAAKGGSSAAAAARKRLDPVFASCQAGIDIQSKTNKALRRAAIADALRARPST